MKKCWHLDDLINIDRARRSVLVSQFSINFYSFRWTTHKFGSTGFCKWIENFFQICPILSISSQIDCQYFCLKWYKRERKKRFVITNIHQTIVNLVKENFTHICEKQQKFDGFFFFNCVAREEKRICECMKKCAITSFKICKMRLMSIHHVNLMKIISPVKFVKFQKMRNLSVLLVFIEIILRATSKSA